MTAGRETLAALIEKARNHVMTPLEIYEQRVSWIYGQLGPESEVTREEIEHNLASMGYARPEASSNHPLNTKRCQMCLMHGNVCDWCDGGGDEPDTDNDVTGPATCKRCGGSGILKAPQ